MENAATSKRPRNKRYMHDDSSAPSPKRSRNSRSNNYQENEPLNKPSRRHDDNSSFGRRYAQRCSDGNKTSSNWPSERLADNFSDRRSYAHQRCSYGNKTSSRYFFSGAICWVCDLNNVSPIGFIEPDCKLPDEYNSHLQVQFYFRNVVDSDLLCPKVGDGVKFRLGSRDPTKPHATQVIVLQYSTKRSIEEIRNLVKNLKEKGNLGAMPSCGSIWKCIGDCTNLEASDIKELIMLLITLGGSQFQNRMTFILETITSTALFRRKMFQQYVSDSIRKNNTDDFQLTCRFLEVIAKYVPHKIKDLLTLIKSIVSESKVELFLYNILVLTSSKAFGSAPGRVRIGTFLTPNTLEMADGPRELMQTVSPVLRKGRYQNVHEYVDINFALLRADCLHAIVETINQVKRALTGGGQLKQLSTYLHRGLKLFGMQFPKKPPFVISVGIQLHGKGGKKIKWKESQMKFGSLVCISVIGNFEDGIWATISCRELLTKGVILLELMSEESRLTNAQAIENLHGLGPQSCLVESRTYFRAYAPVLQHLKQLEPERMPFQDELVFGTHKINSEMQETENTHRNSLDLEDIDGADTRDMVFMFRTPINVLNSDEVASTGVCVENMVQERPYDAHNLRSELLNRESPNIRLDSEVENDTASVHPDLLVNRCIRNSITSRPTTYDSSGSLDFLFENKTDGNFSTNTYNKGRRSLSGPSDATSEVRLENKTEGIISTNTWLHGFMASCFLHITPGPPITPAPLVPESADVVLENKTQAIVSKYTLDESQAQALIDSNERRLVLIQGPPGTGKTYMGVALIDHILKLGQNSNRPILALTYKNRVLDDFLTKIQNMATKRVARLGKFDSASEIHLSNLRQQSKAKSKAQERNTYCWVTKQTGAKAREQEQEKRWKKAHLRDDMANVLNNIHKMYTEMYVLTPDIFFRYLTEEQLNKFPEFTLSALKDWLPRKCKFNEWEEKFESNQGSDFASLEVDILQSNERLNDEHEDNDCEDFVEERFSKAKLCLKDISEVKSHGVWLPHKFSVPLSINFLQRLRNKPNLYYLNEDERVFFVQNILDDHSKSIVDHINLEWDKFKRLAEEFDTLDLSSDAELLTEKDVVGMTITGACIHCDLLAILKPKVVIVEEAGEILEPQLLACLGPWVEKLILIGDHKQLPPSVETHELKTDFYLDTSMLERLINNDLPYSTLRFQSRMRPEFVELVQDIYPDLQTNEICYDNDKPKCAAHSLFMWTHECNESSIRNSFYNDEEIQRSVALTIFFIEEGHDPKRITILAAYREQMRRIRTIMRKQYPQYPVVIHSVDNYQGDENDIVIVSLVRKNKDGKIGFLKERNRMCVLQTRARCGLYLIGNDLTFKSSHHWRAFLKHLREKSLVGPEIPLFCGSHSKPFCAVDKKSLHLCCQNVCGQKFECGIAEHVCPKPCRPYHTHEWCKCTHKVSYTFPECKHSIFKKCGEAPEKLKCSVRKCKKFYTSCDQEHYYYGACAEETKVRCETCEQILKKEKEEESKKQKAELKKKLDSLGKEIVVLNIDTDESTCCSVTEAVEKFFLNSRWKPRVTRVKKICNDLLERKYIKARIQSKCAQNEVHMQCVCVHEDVDITAISQSGVNCGEAGIKIYANAPEQNDIDHDDQKTRVVILCDVFLGNVKTVEHYNTDAENDSKEKGLQSSSYDTVFVKSDNTTRSYRLVYKKEHILPRYVAYFDKEHIPQVFELFKATSFTEANIKPERLFDPQNIEQNHFRIVESQFNRLKQRRSNMPVIESVDLFINPELVAKFSAKQEEYRTKYKDAPDKAQFVLAFHGTGKTNIKTIAKQNFDPLKIKRTVHGHGFYFSEFPDVSEGYGEALLLCMILPGNSYLEGTERKSKIPDGFDSISVDLNENKNAEMLVIDNPDQILPCYQVNVRM